MEGVVKKSFVPCTGLSLIFVDGTIEDAFCRLEDSLKVIAIVLALSSRRVCSLEDTVKSVETVPGDVISERIECEVAMVGVTDGVVINLSGRVV